MHGWLQKILIALKRTKCRTIYYFYFLLHLSIYAQKCCKLNLSREILREVRALTAYQCGRYREFTHHSHSRNRWITDEMSCRIDNRTANTHHFDLQLCHYFGDMQKRMRINHGECNPRKAIGVYNYYNMSDPTTLVVYMLLVSITYRTVSVRVRAMGSRTHRFPLLVYPYPVSQQPVYTLPLLSPSFPAKTSKQGCGMNHNPV